MCSKKEKCLVAGERACFSDIRRYGTDYGRDLGSCGYEKSTPKGALASNEKRTTREEIRQKAKEVALGILGVLVLSMSMIVDIRF